MPRLKAKRQLQRILDGERRPSADAVFDVTLQATGDRELAGKYFNAYIKARMRAGLSVE